MGHWIPSSSSPASCHLHSAEIFIGLIAGASNRIAPDAMAYGHRDAKFVLNVHGRWDEAKG